MEKERANVKTKIEILEHDLRCVEFKLKQADKSFMEAVHRNNKLSEKTKELIEFTEYIMRASYEITEGEEKQFDELKQSLLKMI